MDLSVMVVAFTISENSAFIRKDGYSLIENNSFRVLHTFRRT